MDLEQLFQQEFLFHFQYKSKLVLIVRHETALALSTA